MITHFWCITNTLHICICCLWLWRIGTVKPERCARIRVWDKQDSESPRYLVFDLSKKSKNRKLGQGTGTSFLSKNTNSVHRVVGMLKNRIKLRDKQLNIFPYIDKQGWIFHVVGDNGQNSKRDPFTSLNTRGIKETTGREK